MERLLRPLRMIERAFVACGCVLLFLLMLTVAADVFLRYGLNSPFGWTYDVVSLYLMPGIFFLLLSDSFRGGAQVRVDILRDGFPRRARAAADALGYLCALVVFGVIGARTFGRGWGALMGGDAIAGPIPWPMWPSIMLVPLGCAMLSVRLVIATIGGFLAQEPDSGVENLLAEGGVE
ncbi:MAG: TRAP transporter small permease [Rhodospirillum sp.]|nr:TRAP transporter small permease [Rhodospirillum sp.]MCF8501477.1 TRAP transporter small permease [Rhodospirillum sp.]